MSGSRPTIEDVARAAGVSRATVSRVINNVPGASAPLRARVHQAVVALGYQPNPSARALAADRQPAIDLVAVTFSPTLGQLGVYPYYSRVLAGVDVGAGQLGTCRCGCVRWARRELPRRST